MGHGYYHCKRNQGIKEMSNFSAPAFHPKTGEIEDAMFLDDHFGHREYGVLFSDGKVHRVWDVERVFPKAMALINKLRELKK